MKAGIHVFGWSPTSNGDSKTRQRNSTCEVSGATTPSVSRDFHVLCHWNTVSASICVRGGVSVKAPRRQRAGATMQNHLDDVLSVGPRCPRHSHPTLGWVTPFGSRSKKKRHCISATACHFRKPPLLQMQRLLALFLVGRHSCMC